MPIMISTGLEIIQSAQQKPCFVCDSITSDCGIHLQSAQTSQSKTHLPLKLGQLIGDDFIVIVSVEDRICLACNSLIDHVEQLETELDVFKKVITNQLKSKYNLSDSFQGAGCEVGQHTGISNGDNNNNDNDVKVIDSCKDVNETPYVAAYTVDSGENDNLSLLGHDGRGNGIKCKKVLTNQRRKFYSILKTEKRCNSNQGHSFEESTGITNGDLDCLGNCQENTSSNLNVSECVVESHVSNWICNVCHLHFNDISNYSSHVKTHLVSNVDCEVPVTESSANQKLIQFDDSVAKFKISEIDANLKTMFDDCKNSIFKYSSCSSAPTDGTKQDNLDKLSNFECRVCSSSFSDEESLRLHSRTDCIDPQMTSTNNDDVSFLDPSFNSCVEMIGMLSGQETGTFQCNRCYSRFDGATSYLGHVCTNLKKNDSNEFEVYFTSIKQLSDLPLPSKDNKLSVDCVNAIFLNDPTKLNCIVDNSDFRCDTDLDISTLKEHHIISRHKFDINESSDLQIPVTKFDSTEQLSSDDINPSVTNIVVSDTLLNDAHCLISNADKGADRNFSCDCSFISNSLHEFQAHSSQCSNFFCCYVCKMYIQKASRKEHMEQHNLLLCNICSFETNNKGIFKKHILSHVQKHQEFICQFCSAKFKTKRKLENHEQVHPESFKFACSDCNKVFRKESQLERHREDTHRDPICRFCGKEISNLKSLKYHERRHSKSVGDSEELVCEVCKRVFKTKTGLMHHFAQHTGQFKYFCEFCQRGFMSRMMLEEHRSTHTKEERYVCDICGQKFKFQSTLWIHRKWHSNPFPYKCNFCGRMFRHTSLLAVHKRKHTGERPYKCQHCPASFTVSGTLKRHMILHTKKYPYSCDKCQSFFTSRHKFSVHLAKAHNNFELANQKAPKSENFKMAVREKNDPSKEIYNKITNNNRPNSFEMIQDSNLMPVSLEDDGPNMITSSVISSVNDVSSEQVFEIILDSPLQQIGGIPLSDSSTILPDMWCQ